MLGYQEPAYVVEREAEMPVGGGRIQHFEVRREGTVPFTPGTLPYIALEEHDAEGKRVTDLLFQYDSEEAPNTDWERLISEPTVRVADLCWVQKIVNHHVGYGKDGGIAMY
ncbi:hypothetical protein AB4Y45_33575 [Paraburkholderia sp. EG287A]|uniref:hypothetical protein n=1 Tax=Paraburkholderia sp. EG287A TaxID=3237012 RepID=UPI0034D2A963